VTLSVCPHRFPQASSTSVGYGSRSCPPLGITSCERLWTAVDNVGTIRCRPDVDTSDVGITRATRAGLGSANVPQARSTPELQPRSTRGDGGCGLPLMVGLGLQDGAGSGTLSQFGELWVRRRTRLARAADSGRRESGSFEPGLRRAWPCVQCGQCGEPGYAASSAVRAARPCRRPCHAASSAMRAAALTASPACGRVRHAAMRPCGEFAMRRAWPCGGPGHAASLAMRQAWPCGKPGHAASSSCGHVAGSAMLRARPCCDRYTASLAMPPFGHVGSPAMRRAPAIRRVWLQPASGLATS
jgi:hypothetical protein